MDWLKDLLCKLFGLFCSELPESPPPPPPPPPELASPWVGTSFYQMDSFPIKDIKWFLDNVAKAGGNATEFFLLHTWYKPLHQPWIQRGTYTDNKFPGIKFPLWDLDQFNEKKWDKWRNIFIYCKLKGIIPFVRIEDFCSFKSALEKRYYFNYASYQRHVLKPKKGKAWWEAETIRQRSRLNKKLIQTLKEAGCGKYFLVPMSEAGSLDGMAEERDKAVVDHHKWAIADLRKHGCPKGKIIISTTRAFDELKKLGCKMEIHGCNSDVMLKEIIKKYGTAKIFPNGDGIDKNAKGRRGDKPSKREPSKAQGYKMGGLIKKHNLFGYCYFNRNTERLCREGGGTQIRRAKFDVLKVIRRGYDLCPD